MLTAILVAFLTSVFPTCQPGPAPDGVCQLQQSPTAAFLFVDGYVIEIGAH